MLPVLILRLGSRRQRRWKRRIHRSVGKPTISGYLKTPGIGPKHDGSGMTLTLDPLPADMRRAATGVVCTQPDADPSAMLGLDGVAPRL